MRQCGTGNLTGKEGDDVAVPPLAAHSSKQCLEGRRVGVGQQAHGEGHQLRSQMNVAARSWCLRVLADCSSTTTLVVTTQWSSRPPKEWKDGKVDPIHTTTSVPVFKNQFPTRYRDKYMRR